MRRRLLLAGLLLAATPALAQKDTIGEVQREQQRSAGEPSVPLQNRDAAVADAMEDTNARGWLERAEVALRARQDGVALEALERAESRLLTRSMPADRADIPAQGPLVRHVSAARQALVARDRAGALAQIRTALGLLQR